MRGVIAVTVLALLAAPPIETRQSTYIGSAAADKYRMMYGDPIYWSLSFLVGPDAAGEDRPQVNQAIETRGLLTVVPRPRGTPDVRLCDETLRHCLGLPGAVPEIRTEFFADAHFRHLHEATVTGAFTSEGFIYWAVDSAPPRERAAAGRERVLEQIIRFPDRFAGGPVTLRGGFGGAAPGGGWLLRDGPFFVRVTGREPKGKGWRLDGHAAADCVWQLEVLGLLDRGQGDLVVKAREVRLIGRDADLACRDGRDP
jgi:hypothetical protein